MAVLLTYDVASMQSEVKAALQSKGYSDNWSQNGLMIHLPSTTLWKSDESPAGALTDMRMVANVLRVRLLRCITVEFSATNGIPGE